MVLETLIIRLPSSIRYFWNFGSLLGLNLVIQIVRGLFLSFFFGLGISPFLAVDLINRDILGGWFVRSLHIIGASVFFVLVFFHIIRGIYFQSYWKKATSWVIGVAMLLVLMLISFLGYVLPWGNMSFWGAMVITNFLRTIPYIGKYLLIAIWGGLNVCDISVYRFFSLHFIMPFVLAIFSLIHIFFLHLSVSRNPLKQENQSFLLFFPYFWSKDVIGFFFLFIFFMFLITFFPFTFCDSAKFLEASFAETPEHIKPEWYFLPFYAILRAFPTKSSGVLALVLSVVIFIFFIFFVRRKDVVITIWFGKMIILGYIGGKVVEEPFIRVGKFCSFFYFFLLLCFF